MKINRDNYEAYFLDYHEGQLSSGMVQEVLLFVQQNPDLKSIFDGFEAVSLVADQNIVFENKSSLKKNQVFATSQVNELNYEEFLLNETEGLLTDDQLASLEEFISINPHFEKDRRLYALAHLSSNENIVFEAKELLKHKVIPVSQIDADTFETFMARELEGDLNTDENHQFAEFMQYNPHLEQDRKLYNHTILKAETDIVFENKNSLKQTVIPFRRIVYYALSAAAALALIFSVYFLLDQNEIPRSIAEQGKVKSSVEKGISDPAVVIPDKQLVPNSEKLAGTSTHERLKDKNTSTLTPDNIVITSPEQGSLADIHRQTVKSLQSRSAQPVTSRQYVDPQFTFIRTSQMYMNQHLEFYYNLKLAEDIQYAQLNTKDKNPAKTIFNAATGKADDLFASNRTSKPRDEKKDLSLWTFAELGVQTFNTLTSGDLELKLHKDEEGKVVSYGIESGLIDFEKDVKK